MTFKQIDINFARYQYVIENNGITVVKKKWFSANKQFIPFEDVGSRIARFTERKLGWLTVSLFFFALAISVLILRISGGNVGEGAEIFWGFVGALFFMVYAFTRKNSLFLVKDNQANGIEFLGTKIYEKRVNRFIQSLLQHRDFYLAEKYPIIDGLTIEENIICLNAAVQPNDALFLKKLTQHPIQKLVCENESPETGRPFGICSVITKQNASTIIKDHSDRFVSEGKFIFICEFAGKECKLGLVGTTADPYTIMGYMDTNGYNYDIGPKDIIEKYKKWDQEFGITAIAIGFDFCECEIINRNIDYKKLAAEIYEFCPDTVEQGTDTVELLEEEIKKTGRIFLWWD